MFNWFHKLMEYLGLVTKQVDELDAALDKAAEPLERAAETRRKIEGIGEKAERVGRDYRDLVR